MAAKKKPTGKITGFEEVTPFEKRRKAARLGECCPVFDTIIRRDGSREQQRGFELAVPFVIRTGKPANEAMIYRFPKAKKGFVEPPEFSGVSYALVRFCPFCGTPQESGTPPKSR